MTPAAARRQMVLAEQQSSNAYESTSIKAESGSESNAATVGGMVFCVMCLPLFIDAPG
jgi:hypothetical protein